MQRYFYPIKGKAYEVMGDNLPKRQTKKNRLCRAVFLSFSLRLRLLVSHVDTLA